MGLDSRLRGNDKGGAGMTNGEGGNDKRKSPAAPFVKGGLCLALNVKKHRRFLHQALNVFLNTSLLTFPTLVLGKASTIS